MNTWLELPAGFDEYAWEVEAKGVLLDGAVIRGEQTFRVTFYDQTRLRQDVEEDLRLGGVFSQARMIVLPKLTRELMIDAVAALPDEFFA